MRKHTLGIILISGVLLSSCNKITSPDQGEAQWIKVIDDSAVFFPGKIVADADDNLYCSYNYGYSGISGTSAIIKIDREGNFKWRKTFTDLAIWDFTLSPEQDLVVVDSSNDIVSLTLIPAAGGDEVLLGSFVLPPAFDSLPFNQLTGLKVISGDNGYIIGGSYTCGNYNAISMCFLAETDFNGIPLWFKNYFVGSKPHIASLTGCCKTNEGNFMLFGYSLMDPDKVVPDTTAPQVVTSFFTMKISPSGDSVNARYFTTSIYEDSTYSGYFCNTSNMVADQLGNLYGCAYNILYNAPRPPALPIPSDDQNSARVFKFNSEGEIVDTRTITFEVQNEVADLAVKDDGRLLIGLNPYKLIQFGFVGDRHSFFSQISSSFDLLNTTPLQSQYTDYLGSVCSTSDGFAIETMIQSLGESFYRLQIVKTDINGNF